MAVLLRITEVFGVDATFFASHDDTRLVAEMREVAMDRDLGADMDVAEVADMVAAYPNFARAMVNLHRRYRLTTTQLAAATEDRYSDGSGSGSITMPHEEVRDYFYQRQNYLHELDTAAEDLTAKIRMHRGDLAGELANRLTTEHGVRIVRRIDLGDTVLHRYDPATKTLEMGNHLSRGQQVFKMAAELAFLEFGQLIDKMVDEGMFTSDESRTLARLGLANYFAAATVLPYRQFHDVAENFRYDVERLSAFYSVSYETIAHRLSTLQRPSMRGVPFSFVRVDRAGNMSKRQSATGFHFFLGRHLPAVECVRNLHQPGQDPGADRADARRPQLLVGGPHSGAPRVALRATRQDLRDRAGMRTAPCASAGVLRRAGPLRRGHHAHRVRLPGV